MAVRRETTDEVRDGDAAVVNAAVAVSSGEGRSSTYVRTRQRIVQRSGKTRVTTERMEQTDREGRDR
ncbi:MAG: hypothetical protein ABR613_09250 [Actinomycetota bacterium]